MKSPDQIKDVANCNEGSALPTAGRSAPQDIAGTKEKPGAKAKATGNPGGRPGAGLRTGKGNGHGNGHSVGAKPKSTAVTAKAAVPKPQTRFDRRQSEVAQAVAEAMEQPRYDTRLRYGTFHYVATDPVLPPAGTATAKLELGSRSDTALAAFGESHIMAMTGNAFFPTPEPTAEVFAGSLAAFEAKFSALENLRLEVKNLTFEKDQARKEFEFQFTRRRAYIQTASNSNAEVIASAGLSIRNAATPMGALLPPVGLRVELTTFNGELDVRWNTVAGAKSYVLECAEVITGEALLWVQVTMGGKLSHLAKQLTPGKHYAFRVATIGGSNGVSQWSPVVQRMAA